MVHRWSRANGVTRYMGENMRTVLITGSSGLVGSAAAKAFKEKGYKVVGIDNNSRAHFFGTQEKTSTVDEFYNIDITSEFALKSVFITHKPDVIIHAAAQPSHDYSKDHVLEDFRINAFGTVLLLETTRKHCPDATFLYVSTDKVYGENMQGEKESDELLGLDFAGARSPFGCSKAAGDMYVQEYGNYFGMKTVCFRPGCITGKAHEGAELHGFLAYLAKCIRTETPYKIFGNGKNVRDQIHADDLAQAFVVFAEAPRIGSVYNMGGGLERAISVLEAISLIEKETNKVCDFAFYAARKGDRIYDVHDTGVFRRDYPEWKYQYSLADIIRDVCEKTL